MYKNINAQPNYTFDDNDVATGYEIFKTDCVFLLKTSMPALNFVFSDNLILQDLELVDGCELHIISAAATI